MESFTPDPGPPVFRTETTTEGRAARLAVFGDIDLATVRALERRTQTLIAEHQLAHLVLDLRGATFLDSLGLGLLVSLQRSCQNEGRRLTIVPGPPQVHRMLEISGLDRLFEFTDRPGLDETA